MAIVSLVEAKRHLRVEQDVTLMDQDIQLLIDGVSQLVLSFVKKTSEEFLDSAGEEVYPPAFKIATLVWVGILFKNRDGASDETLQLGEVPRTVSSLLWQYRPLSAG